MMGLEMLLLPLLIVFAVWYVSQGQNQADRRGGSAEDALRSRFANGEIDDAEFEHRLALLRR